MPTLAEHRLPYKLDFTAISSFPFLIYLFCFPLLSEALSKLFFFWRKRNLFSLDPKSVPPSQSESFLTYLVPNGDAPGLCQWIGSELASLVGPHAFVVSKVLAICFGVANLPLPISQLG